MLSLDRRAAQFVIAAVTAGVLSSCATSDTGHGLGLPPTARGAEKPEPYDPFGFGKADAPKANPDANVSSNGGANTVSKSKLAAATPAQSPAPSAQSTDIGASASGPFAGISGDELKARWGVPNLMRNEAGAALWQFQGKGCVVLAYLYPSSRGGLETAFAEARPGGDSAAAVNGCLGKGPRAKEASPSPATARAPALLLKPN